ncbi:cordon-bleu protein-like 1 isoform X7 [Mirounga angustirostris]|uniref:cordon-bleu protein-like 1 isoform X7 n=1 Tax=Mirounga angustirostris TaxID=9716 RepID=UPI00313D55CC
MGMGTLCTGVSFPLRSPSRTPKTRSRVGGKFLPGSRPPPPVFVSGSLPLSLRCHRASSPLLGGRPAEVAASSGAPGREMGQLVTRRLGTGVRAAPRRAMDSRTPRSQDALAAPTPPAAPTGRKPKAKAPRPPAETRYVDASSVDDPVESSACIMEQKENMIDKDIELSVVLPGDIIKSTTVHGSKPMMDLLIFLCAQYHLNPSSYTIDLQSSENNPIKFKPNTPIGMLEVEKVILKPKILDKKKPTPIIPEKTVRVVINFKKTQKTIVRVSPHAPLQELAPIICSKCEFDPLHTLLLKDYLSQEPLDLTKSLNDLGLRELYAMDVSRESCQVSQNLDIMKEKENKGFFSFFQRSKKKREQSPCGASIVRTGSLQLSSTSVGDSSLKRTKRKAPSPPSKIPLHPSDESSPVTAPQAGRTVPSDGVLEANPPKGLPSPDFTSLAEASLDPGLPSLEHSTVPRLLDEASLSECSRTAETAVASLTSGISSDHSLEEIDEKEELSEVPKDEAENISLKSQDIPSGSTDIINTLKNDPDSALGNVTGESSQNSKEEKQEARNTDGQGLHIMVYNTSREERVVDSVRNLKSLGLNQENVDQNEVIVIPPNTEDHMKNGVRRKEINVGGVAKNNNVDMEADRLSNYQAHKTDTAESYKENHLAASLVQDQKLNQPSEEKTKMQDTAIQTVPSTESFDGNHRDHNLSNFKVNESVQTPSNNKSTQHSPSSPQDSVDASRKFRSQGPVKVHSENQLTIKDPICTHGNDRLLPPVDGNDKNSAFSHVKNYPLYRQDYDPKPKPSNEITREYIPKTGMTTYKIVPPKSLEILKNWDSETTGYNDDQEMHTLGRKPTDESVKETAVQTEDLVVSESPREPQADVQLRLTPRTEHQVLRLESSPCIAVGKPLKPAPRVTKDPGTAPFAPNLEDINNILESKLKSRVSNAQTKPSSFFLQMQKRVSGHYVTSAAARSVHGAPNPAPKELVKKEEEKDARAPPGQTLGPVGGTAPPLPQPPIDQHTAEERGGPEAADTSPPPRAPGPAPLPASRLAALNLKTLKTFGAPRPYASSAPSPFALAVVKRSQSLSKVRPELGGERAFAPPPPDSEGGKAPSVHPSVGLAQLCVRDEGNNSAHNEQNSQIPSPTDCPSLILKRQSSLTFQSSDPEQIRQSLLTAIRSGEAAAKLKRVTVPSNTISVNGRSRLSHSMSPDAQDSH